MKISFVIPCYRSEKTIESVVSDIRSVVQQARDFEWEVIMVSDNSPDSVYAVIEKICRIDPKHLKGLELSRNFGQHGALMAGYAHASGDVIFSLDDDGQAPVESIYSFLDKLDEGIDIVIGSYANKKHSLFRNLGTCVNFWMAEWLLDKPRNVQLTSFFAMKRFVKDEMLKYTGPFPYLAGLMFRITKNIANIEVKHRERKEGESGYTFLKLLGLWMNGFTAFSVKPLRLASFIGLGCAFCGLVYGLWTVAKKLFVNPEIPLGYSSLMCAVLFVGGIIMMTLGLIGEYIGRIYICINRSPQYVVGRRTWREEI